MSKTYKHCFVEVIFNFNVNFHFDQTWQAY